MRSFFSDDGRISRGELLAVVGITVLAGVLRMGWPGLGEFKADEARMYVLALDLAQGNSFPIRGLGSSVGFPNFPMSIWLYAIPLLFWKHIYAATLFTGLLNTVSVVGCWWLVRRYWGPRAALMAMVMYAVSPWALIYSRKIWAQNLLPLFVCGWAIGGLLAYVERRQRWIVLHLVCLSITVQIHLAAVVLVPATMILGVVFWRRLDWRWVVAGCGLGALLVVPFAYYMVTADLSPAAALEAAEQFEGGTDLQAVAFTGFISVGRQIYSMAGPEAYQDYLALVPDMTTIYWLWGALMLGGLGWLGWQAWHKRGIEVSEAGLLVVIWLIVPPLFFIRHSTPVFPHYFIATYPAQYIAAGVAFVALLDWQARRAWINWAGAGLLTASVVAQVWVWGVLLGFVSQRATPDAYGTPIAMQLQVVDAVQQAMAESGATEVIVAGSGEQAELDGDVAVYDLLLADMPRRFVDVTRSAVFPATPSVVLLLRPDAPLAELYTTAATETTVVPLRDGEPSLMVLTVFPEEKPVLDHTLDPPRFFANGVVLIGYDTPEPAGDTEALTWRIYWHTGTPSGQVYNFFNHLLDANGKRVGQADGAAFSAWQWHDGDAVVSEFVIDWPEGDAGVYTARTGMYTYPGLENVPALDAAANPASDAIEMIVEIR